jgi:N-ethylmaleimide reductase
MLFEPFQARSLQLGNRMVVAPMTRSRAVDGNAPNALMAEYYGQRASAGLIITEGTTGSATRASRGCSTTRTYVGGG